MHKLLALLVSSFVVAGCATPPLPANVTVAPDPVDFGQVFVGDAKNMGATLTNGTAAAINVKASSLDPGTVFAIGATPPAPPVAVAAAGTLAFPFTFTPPTKGTHNGTWHLTLDRRPYAIGLTGEGVLYLLVSNVLVSTGATAADGLNFGDVVVGTTKNMDIAVRNTNFNGAAITFPNAPALAPAGPPFTVARPGANTTINAPPNPSMVKIRVVFAPTAVGHFTAVLTWADGTGAHSLKCFVQGNGIAGGN